MLLTKLDSAAVAMVITACLAMLHIAQCLKGPDDDEEDATAWIQDIGLSKWRQSYNENQMLLVLFYEIEGCDDCPMAMERVNKLSVSEKPYLLKGIKIVMSADRDLVSHLEIDQFPSLVFLRDKSYLMYDGNFDEQDLLLWVQAAREKATQRLDDESFENVTREASGASAGDWLVVFYKESCKNVLPMAESLGVRTRGKTNVGKVDMRSNRRLVDRFDIKQCPEVILLAQGLMYKYNLPSLNVASLRAFVEGVYKSGQGQPLPAWKPTTGSKKESHISQAKPVEPPREPQKEPEIVGESNYMVLMNIFGVDGETIYTAVVSAAIIFFLIVLIAFCCRTRPRPRKPRKPKKE